MQRMLKLIGVLLLAVSAAVPAYAATSPVSAVKAGSHFTSQVNVVNQSGYSYTVTASYMSQAGTSRKYVMGLSPYPLTGSSIQFPIVLPEYAVYLQVVRNIDGYLAYAGYLSSDDVYIYPGLAGANPKIEVSHH